MNYIAITDKCDEEPYKALETIRVCNGLNGVKEYQHYLDCINENQNYHHELHYKPLLNGNNSVAAASEELYVAVGIYRHYGNGKISPDIETARSFKDVKTAKEYISTLPYKLYKYGAIIEINKLYWNYRDYYIYDEYNYPNAVNVKKDVKFVTIKKNTIDDAVADP